MMALELDGMPGDRTIDGKKINEAGIEKSGREHRGPGRSEIVLTFFYQRGRVLGRREPPGADRFNLHAPGL
jgi:hypothetical protein